MMADKYDPNEQSDNRVNPLFHQRVSSVPTSSTDVEILTHRESNALNRPAEALFHFARMSAHQDDSRPPIELTLPSRMRSSPGCEGTFPLVLTVQNVNCPVVRVKLSSCTAGHPAGG